MISKKTILVASLMAFCFITMYAQRGLPTKQIADSRYYYYEIKNKETLYGIAQQLGVSQDVIIAYNPWVSSGLEKKQLIFLPTVATTINPNEISEFYIPQNSDPITHTITAGETLSIIAKKYNASVEGIIRSNLGLRPDQYTPGEKIRVVPNSAMPFAYEKNTVKFIRYIPVDGESYASIANRYNIFIADLQAANPNTKKPKKGKMIVVPEKYTEKLMGEMRSISIADLETYYEPRLNDIYDKMLSDKKNGELNIGLILPFQLHKSNPPKQAYLYTDFYKGFLIALDSVKNISTRRINVKVYDTQHNLNVTDSLLALPELRDLSIIIAPSEPQQLARINNFGKENNIDVLNCFSTKNDDHLNNPNVYQVNTPTKDFTANVLKWFDTQFADFSVIYLDDPDAQGKDIFTDIRAHISDNGMPSSTISVSGDLSFDRLSREMNPGTRYVFIPSSSSKNLLKKIVKALKQAKEERFDCDMVLLGYPEYTLYLKEYQSDLQTIDTYMFSRFFNAKGFRTRDFDTLYRRWFGGSTIVSYPNMGLLGYDTAMMIVKAFNATGNIGDAPLHKGIQTSFRFERESNWGGFVNQAIDIVHFTTDHSIITDIR